MLSYSYWFTGSLGTAGVQDIRKRAGARRPSLERLFMLCQELDSVLNLKRCSNQIYECVDLTLLQTAEALRVSLGSLPQPLDTYRRSRIIASWNREIQSVGHNFSKFIQNHTPTGAQRSQRRSGLEWRPPLNSAWKPWFNCKRRNWLLLLNTE